MPTVPHAEVPADVPAAGMLAESDREALILEFLPLVKHLARRILSKLPPSVELNDLIGAGVMGLIDAVDKFDPSRNVRFKTYAEIRIRGAILDSLRALDLASRSLREKARKIEETCWQLEQAMRRSPSDDEIAKALGVSVSEFSNILADLRFATLGGFTIPGQSDEQGEDVDLIEYIPAPDSGVHLLYERQQLRRELVDALKRLSEREQQVIALYYYEELSMRQIGEVLGVGEARVSQIHSRIMLKLRGRLRHLTNESR